MKWPGALRAPISLDPPPNTLNGHRNIRQGNPVVALLSELRSSGAPSKCLGTGVRWGIHPRHASHPVRVLLPPSFAKGGDVYTGRGVGSDGRWPTFIFPSPILTEPLRWVSSRRFVGHDTWRHTVAHFYSTLGPWPICIQIINCSLKLFYSNNLRLNIPSCISYK